MNKLLISLPAFVVCFLHGLSDWDEIDLQCIIAKDVGHFKNIYKLHALEE